MIDRKYDIWITNYSDKKNNLREYADYYNESKDAKFLNLKKVLAEHRDQISAYKAIMIADDDIIISPAKLNNLFDMIENYDLWIVTPAFSRLGKITHDTTSRQLLSKYRHTNFAENTCPIFKTDKLLDFMDAYDGSVKSYGIDWWYLNHLGNENQNRIIISDENYCINPRDFSKKGGMREIDMVASADVRKNLWHKKKEELGISAFEKVIYSSVNRNFLEVMAASPGYFFEKLVWLVFEGRSFKKIREIAKSIIVFWRGQKTKQDERCNT